MPSRAPALDHQSVWTAIDDLAERHGLSASGLARRAGLDPTTFNRSKRVASDGRPRWPSTESIAKILEATGAGLDDFFAAVRASAADDPLPTQVALPLLGDLRGGAGGFTEDGERGPMPLPRVAARAGRDRRAAGRYGVLAGAGAGSPVPSGAAAGPAAGESASRDLFALPVSDDSMLPAYRGGDLVIAARCAEVRRADRVVVRTRDGRTMIRVVSRVTSRGIEFAPLNAVYPVERLSGRAIDWMARILWVSQ